jgi:hypothetical protein
MKFRVTALEECSIDIDVADLAAAEAYGVEWAKRLGGFPKARLLTILPVVAAPADDKPPTPFGKPPSGTPGTPVLADEVITEARAA